MGFPSDGRSASEEFARGSMASDCVLGCPLGCVGGTSGAPAGSWALELAAGSKLTEGKWTEWILLWLRARSTAEHAIRVGSIPSIYLDRKSTRLNSSHPSISYAVFCLKKKNTSQHPA